MKRPSVRPVNVRLRRLLVMLPWLRERGLQAHVSVSDEADNVIAFVVVEQAGPTASPPTSAQEPVA